jgi:hypothetical protein
MGWCSLALNNIVGKFRSAKTRISNVSFLLVAALLAAYSVRVVSERRNAVSVAADIVGIASSIENMELVLDGSAEDDSADEDLVEGVSGSAVEWELMEYDSPSADWRCVRSWAAYLRDSGLVVDLNMEVERVR